jgi:hypothetical protein
VSIVACAAIAVIFLPLRQADALAELKAFAPYPSARNLTFSTKSQYRKAADSWASRGGVGSDRNRSLDVTVVTMTFETRDDPDLVLTFYESQATNKQYDAIVSNPPDRQFLRYESPFDGVGSVLELMNIDADVPVTFYQLKVSAVKTTSQNASGSTNTYVTVEVGVFQETGGIQDRR